MQKKVKSQLVPPAPKGQARRLAAILFADIAGYTALMQKDEATASALLHRFQQEMENKVAENNGSIVNFYGDGALCTFQNPLEAVRCAMALQTEFREEPAVPVRIGIHSGTVVFENDKVYGDSVNLASRIESMGVPGTVLLSNKIRDDIKNHPEFQLASLGSFEFKNVDEPMEVFALANEGFPVPKREEMEGKLKTPFAQASNWKKWAWAAGIALTALAAFLFYKNDSGGNAVADAKFEKSIAVLPFKNSSAEEENQFFCDGVMEAVLDHLSKIEGLKVISRTSMERFRYSKQSIADIATELNVANILAGSVQRQGGKVRISVQLIEAKTDRQIWSDSYDRELTDIFSIQSEIAQNIAGQLQIELSPAVKATLSSQPTTNLTAYDYYLQGREQLVKFFADRKEVYYQNARLNFLKATETDSLLAPAWADHALAIWLRRYWHDDFPIDAAMDTVRIYCEKALSIDPNLPQAHVVLGNFYLKTKDEKRFVEEQMKALESNGNYAAAYRNLGAYYADPRRGEYEKGIQMLKKTLQLDPTSAWTTDYYQSLTIAYLNIGGFTEAEDYGKHIRELGDLTWWNSLVHMYLMQGKYPEAEALANEWKAKSPAALRYSTEIEVNYHKNYKKAIEQYKEFEKRYPYQLNFRQRFGLAYWLDGQKEKGRALMLEALREYEKAAESSGNQTCYDEAGIYATLGDTQKAIAILRDKRCTLTVGLEYYILIDPLYQNLWGNTKFQAIVQARQAEKAEILRKIRQSALKN